MSAVSVVLAVLVVVKSILDESTTVDQAGEATLKGERDQTTEDQILPKIY